MHRDLAALFDRDLTSLMNELRAYPDEAGLWRVQGDIVNPAGTLALHLTGNLRALIGDALGGEPYRRDRDAEFARRDVPRAELLSELEHTRDIVGRTLRSLDDARLTLPHPNLPPSFAPDTTTGAFLLHLYGHLSWHLGQVNYHRRLTAARPDQG